MGTSLTKRRERSLCWTHWLTFCLTLLVAGLSPTLLYAQKDLRTCGGGCKMHMGTCDPKSHCCECNDPSKAGDNDCADAKALLEEKNNQPGIGKNIYFSDGEIGRMSCQGAIIAAQSTFGFKTAAQRAAQAKAKADREAAKGIDQDTQKINKGNTAILSHLNDLAKTGDPKALHGEAENCRAQAKALGDAAYKQQMAGNYAQANALGAQASALRSQATDYDTAASLAQSQVWIDEQQAINKARQAEINARNKARQPVLSNDPNRPVFYEGESRSTPQNPPTIYYSGPGSLPGPEVTRPPALPDASDAKERTDGATEVLGNTIDAIQNPKPRVTWRDVGGIAEKHILNQLPITGEPNPGLFSDEVFKQSAKSIDDVKSASPITKATTRGLNSIGNQAVGLIGSDHSSAGPDGGDSGGGYSRPLLPFSSVANHGAQGGDWNSRVNQDLGRLIENHQWSALMRDIDNLDSQPVPAPTAQPSAWPDFKQFEKPKTKSWNEQMHEIDDTPPKPPPKRPEPANLR